MHSNPSLCSDSHGADVFCTSECLLGCVARTPLGWGVVTRDSAAESHVHVALDWRLRNGRRVSASVRRVDILERSFCAVGQCVETHILGAGVLLDFRREDRQHIVRLWRPRGRGAATLFCLRRALRRVLRAAPGFPAVTPDGTGIVRAIEEVYGGSCGHESTVRYLVDFGWGDAYVDAERIRCPMAAALPVAECFGQMAERELAQCARMVAGLKQGLSSTNPTRLLEAAHEAAPSPQDLLVRASDASLADAGRALRVGIQRISHHPGSEPVRAELAQIVGQRTGAHSQGGGEEFQRLRRTAEQSQTGQVLAQGGERLAEEARGFVRDTGAPQLERLRSRAWRLIGSVAADETARLKTQEFLLGAWGRVDEKLARYSPALAAETGSIAADIASQCGGAARQCGEALAVRLEGALAAAVEASVETSNDTPLAATEFLDRFQALQDEPALAASLPSGGALAFIDAAGLGLAVPLQVRETLARDSGRRPLEAAMLDGVDGTLAAGAKSAVAKGEALMRGISRMAQSKPVLGVLERLESDDLEGELLDGLAQFNPSAFLRDCDQAMAGREAGEAFANKLLDHCLDFLLRILPSINIPEVSGEHNGAGFEVHDLNMSGFHFRKQDVRLSLQTPNAVGSSSGVSGADALLAGEAVLAVLDARDITAKFRRLHCKVKPKHLPNASMVTNAKASGIALHLHLAARLGSNDGAPTELGLRVSQLKISMEKLDVSLDKPLYALLFNPLIAHLNEFLKAYICGALEEKLAGPSQDLCSGLSDLLTEARPALVLLGWLPSLAGSRLVTGPVSTAETVSAVL